jgi:hypothetical protein
MSGEKKLVLHYKMDDERSRQLAADFWRGSYVQGKWQWSQPTDAVIAASGLRRTEFMHTVHRAADAFDDSLTCQVCSMHPKITTRTEFTGKNYGDFTCAACRTQKLEQAAHERFIQEQKELEERIRIVEEQILKIQPFDYGTISYFDAALIYAIMLASDEACELGTFSDSQRLHLCASNGLSGDLLDRLLDAGLLFFSSGTPARAVQMGEGGRWSYFPDLVTWQLAPDAGGSSFPQLMTRLGALIDSRDTVPDFYEAVEELWNMLGFDDVSSYLRLQVGTFKLPDYRIGPKTDEALRYALERFSIPQVRGLILGVVKNAAALSVSRDFNNRGHAMMTIPGSLMRRVDRALAESWFVKAYTNNWTDQEPVLLTLLFDRVMGTGQSGFRILSGSGLKNLALSAAS